MKKEETILRLNINGESGVVTHLLGKYSVPNKDIEANLVFYIENKSKEDIIIELRKDEQGFKVIKQKNDH